MPNPVEDEDVIVRDDWIANGYARANEAVLEAMKVAVATEGLITEPAYTAKAFSGFLNRAREADPGKTLLFIHTGGTPPIFAYERDLTEAFSR